ncbi:phage tail protein [Methylobacterium oryzihabitans]|uniref:Phage tail protein n=1 Tax=Methylobacterium oryzihabitans TaxID=2499852 RepID=A0A437NT45_9HYPH|nr:phage tail protein [Methylobacterium oryzihabitans]RVU13205.1 phage tail protein [Methylobacterium oryzihabitans]
MLYQLGPLTLDTFPFSADGVEREIEADFARHDVMNRRRPHEFEGAGDETLDISGSILPFHTGGLSHLDLAQSLCEDGRELFVMRGDGRVLGWYVLKKVGERHRDIGPGGVGFVVGHRLGLERAEDPGEAAGAGLVATLLSLFG